MSSSSSRNPLCSSCLEEDPEDAPVSVKHCYCCNYDLCEKCLRYHNRLSPNCTYPCDVCESDDEMADTATFTCLDCKKNFCCSCNRFHNKFEKGHRVVPFHPDALKAKDRSLFDDFMLTCWRLSPFSPEAMEVAFQLNEFRKPCPFHLIERLNIWCVTCRELICTHCLFAGSHRGHKHDNYQTLLKKRFNYDIPKQF